MRYLLAVLVLAAGFPGSADAQRDVTRRTYTFLEHRLDVAVLAEAPGELQVVRGQRGRIEVAARARDGFAGSGLGGDLTRQLRLTAVGSDAVHYLVVVPEHVHVRVQLPDGATSTLPSRSPVATFRWGAETGDTWERAPTGSIITEMLPTTASGLYVAFTSPTAPRTIDIRDLRAVRSLSLRVQGSHFSIAASRPLTLDPGARERIALALEGEPLDLVVYIPRGTSGLEMRSGGQRLARVTAGRPESRCGGAVLQQPTAHQDWLTLFPRQGELSCR